MWQDWECQIHWSQVGWFYRLGYLFIYCIQKVNVYQSFTYFKDIGDGIVYCKDSYFPYCVEEDDALNLPLTAAAKIQAMIRQPEDLYIGQLGHKPITEVGLYKYSGLVIPN